MFARRTGRPRVLEAVDGKVVYERGSAESFGAPDRVALLVHWAPTPRLSRSFVELSHQLDEHGYRPVVVSACEAPGTLDWGERGPGSAVVLRKPNLGYDFGSWAVGLNELPAIASANRVILANDSLAGPFTDLGVALGSFEDSRADAWGMTDTRQYFRHLQSYFIGFNGGVLSDPPLRRFFDNVRVERNKWDIIDRYELGLTRLFREECYGFSSWIHCGDVVPAGQNPVIRGWRRLLEKGYPFVKREILTSPEVAPAAETVPDVVRAMFGERVEEWV
jgi:hypothetical protein